MSEKGFEGVPRKSSERDPEKSKEDLKREHRASIEYGKENKDQARGATKNQEKEAEETANRLLEDSELSLEDEEQK